MSKGGGIGFRTRAATGCKVGSGDVTGSCWRRGRTLARKGWRSQEGRQKGTGRLGECTAGWRCPEQVSNARRVVVESVDFLAALWWGPASAKKVQRTGTPPASGLGVMVRAHTWRL